MKKDVIHIKSGIGKGKVTQADLLKRVKPTIIGQTGGSCNKGIKIISYF